MFEVKALNMGKDSLNSIRASTMGPLSCSCPLPLVISPPFWTLSPSNYHLKEWHGDFPGGAVVKIRLPMQGTRVQPLVREDPTCRGATKPVRQEPVRRNKRSHPMRSLRTATKSSPCSPQLEKACAQQQQTPTQPKINK